MVQHFSIFGSNILKKYIFPRSIYGVRPRCCPSFCLQVRSFFMSYKNSGCIGFRLLVRSKLDSNLNSSGIQQILSKSAIILGVKIASNFGQLNTNICLEICCSNSKQFFYYFGTLLSHVKDLEVVSLRIVKQMLGKLTSELPISKQPIKCLEN